MTVITEAELREMWQSGKGNIAVLPQGTKLTPSAKDFIKEWNLTIIFEGDTSTATNDTDASNEAESAQPVAAEAKIAVPSAHALRYLLKGKPIIPAPTVRAQKSNTPRLLLKGRPILTSLLDFGNDDATKSLQLAKIDTLTAHFLLATAQARRFNLPELGNALAQLAVFTHAIATTEHNGQALPALKNEDIFKSTAKSSPVPETHEMLLYLNLLRAQINEIRLSAQNANCSRAHTSALDTLVTAVNHLLLQFKAGKFPWTASGWQKPSSN